MHPRRLCVRRGLGRRSASASLGATRTLPEQAPRQLPHGRDRLNAGRPGMRLRPVASQRAFLRTRRRPRRGCPRGKAAATGQRAVLCCRHRQQGRRRGRRGGSRTAPAVRRTRLRRKLLPSPRAALRTPQRRPLRRPPRRPLGRSCSRFLRSSSRRPRPRGAMAPGRRSPPPRRRRFGCSSGSSSLTSCCGSRRAA